MRHRPRTTLLAAAAAGVALLLSGGPASAQLPSAPPEACGALDTVGGTAGGLQDTAEGAVGQDLPADVDDTAGTVGSTSGCPQASTGSGDDYSHSTTTTAYESGTAVLGASSSGALPRTGAPATVAGAGAGALALVIAALGRVALRRLA